MGELRLVGELGRVGSDGKEGMMIERKDKQPGESGA